MPILGGAQSLKVTALALGPSETGGLGEARRLHETATETGLFAGHRGRHDRCPVEGSPLARPHPISRPFLRPIRGL